MKTALDSTTAKAIRHRRDALGAALGGGAALIAAGFPRSRNYAAWTYPFRASSHFVYLTGLSLPKAMLLWNGDRWRLFVQPPAPDDALWHGPTATMNDLAEAVGCEVVPLNTLDKALGGLTPSTVPVPDARGCHDLEVRLHRPIRPGQLDPIDAPLADALIEARLRCDDAGLREISSAVAATTAAFDAGMRTTTSGTWGWTVRAAMIEQVIARGMQNSFNPIVSVCGEVLHNESSDDTLNDGDLLLVDFGVESRGGWASDVTRTWPVSGRFSPTQRDLYDVVLAAQKSAIDTVDNGTRYRDVHLAASRTIAQGLVDLGILKGSIDGLVEDGVHALFFPHGVGHLMGLDVHDMEDLGDRAGYAPGRRRADQFGLGYLRLDRDLAPGMVVTIEPGFYNVPAILSDPKLTAIAGDRLDRDRLAMFADVRGIRIEDDVLVTETGREVLTAAIPKAPEDLEAAIGRA